MSVPRPSKISREQVVDAAARAFSQNGYESVSLQEIANRLGVRKAAIYYYSKSKEELLFDISRDAMQRSIDRLNAVITGELPADEAMRRAVECHIIVLSETLPEHRTMMNELRSLNEEHLKHILNMRRQYEQLFGGLLERGSEEGVFRYDDHKITLRAILGTINWTIHWLYGGDSDVRHVADVLANFVLHGLRSGGLTIDSAAPAPASRVRRSAARPRTRGGSGGAGGAV